MIPSATPENYTIVTEVALFFAEDSDQGDLPGPARFPEGGSESHFVERRGVSLPALAVVSSPDPPVGAA